MSLRDSRIPDSPHTSHQKASFRHEALFYSGLDDLIVRTVPFVHAGLDAGEGVVVALPPEKLGPLGAALGPRADRVGLVDLSVVGRNPARIIPAWQRFVAEAGPGRRMRGIGEPIWAGRSDAEVVESQLHEALINVALGEAGGMSLMCPYDVSVLPEGVLHEARCSHPHLSGVHGEGPSPAYCGFEVSRSFDQPLPPPTQRPEVMGIDRTTLPEVRQMIAARAERAGLSALKRSGVVLAVHELATNSLRHGGGTGVLRAWNEGAALLCEVKDRGHIRDRLVGRRNPAEDQIGGRGLWLVNQLCDLVQIRSTPEGTVVRVAMHADGPEGAAESLPAA